jgi:hypothetical protein
MSGHSHAIPPPPAPYSAGSAPKPQSGETASVQSAPVQSASGGSGSGKPEPMAASPAIAAQLLATEHWSLLATRGTMWAEVMSRITIHLTVASGSLVILALVAQGGGFGSHFQVLSIGLTCVVLVLGTLTSIRVHLASDEDAGLILGMNRLRSAYVDLVPGMEPYLVASTRTDRQGLIATYAMGGTRPPALHVVGSTAFFLTTVNSFVSGTLGALVASAAGASLPVIVVVGVLCGAAYYAAFLYIGYRTFSNRRLEQRIHGPGA